MSSILPLLILNKTSSLTFNSSRLSLIFNSSLMKSNVNFCKRLHLPKGNYNVTGLLTDRPILRDDIWKDLHRYVSSNPNLEYRKLTKAEKFVFVHLPNAEIKRMYLDKILSRQ